LYYTELSKWQVVEERVGSSSDTERTFVWGLRYIDDLLLRDRDTDGNGSLDERLYAMQDANWNVTAITNASGTIQERYAYAAYGVPTFADAAFVVRGSSSYQWETLYAGYRWDAAAWIVHIRNRCYQPVTGVWSQRDPIGYIGETSLYVYVSNSPLTYCDHTGLAPLPPTPVGYGYYCGPSRKASCVKDSSGAWVPAPSPVPNPAPIDALDAACMFHDCCLFGIWQVLCVSKICNKYFCDTIKLLNCHTMYPSDPIMEHHCDVMMGQAKYWFC
jgi:RHS repeat-associated protein